MKENLTDINTLEDLQARIRLLKSRIKEREQDIEARWKSLPEETFKVAVGYVVPTFLSNKLAGGTWNLLKGAIGLIKGNKTKEQPEQQPEGWKEKLAGPAKQVGIFALLKMLYGFVKK